MSIYYEDSTTQILHGSCVPVLEQMPDESMDAVVTDPPYGLAATSPASVTEAMRRWVEGERDYLPGGAGFMGHQWDAFVPPPAVWDECFRVLKPGGHVLAFAGSRTYDLMTLGLRLAGFEIRDGIAWIYSTGFPKSRNVTEAMDAWRAGETQGVGPTGPRPGVYEVTAFLRKARDAAGWNNADIDGLFGTHGMASHWTSQASQPAVPSVAQWRLLKRELGFGGAVDNLVELLGATERPEQVTEASKVTSRRFLGSLDSDPDADPATGWGTALKPAFEPVVCARKPPQGSITANVARRGVGALNIDGCRVPMGATDRDQMARGAASWTQGSQGSQGSQDAGQTRADGSLRKPTTVYGEYGVQPSAPSHLGRWPTNVVLQEGQVTAELDVQAGVAGEDRASRYFPAFRYQPKAGAGERPCVDGVQHHTVKPLGLMRWLVRLVTPPGGTVLDPFAGSGTTLEACLLERFHAVGIEREEHYLPLIASRIHRHRDAIAALETTGADLGLFGLDAA